MSAGVLDPASRPRGPSRLLVVEDDPALRRILMLELTELGYTVDPAGGYRDTLRAVARRDYRYALIDYRLPDGNGHDILVLLRGLQPAIRMVLMSAELTERQEREARLAGARAAVVKPVSALTLDRLFRD